MGVRSVIDLFERPVNLKGCLAGCVKDTFCWQEITDLSASESSFSFSFSLSPHSLRFHVTSHIHFSLSPHPGFARVWDRRIRILFLPHLHRGSQAALESKGLENE